MGIRFTGFGGGSGKGCGCCGESPSACFDPCVPPNTSLNLNINFHATYSGGFDIIIGPCNIKQGVINPSWVWEATNPSDAAEGCSDGPFPLNELLFDCLGEDYKFIISFRTGPESTVTFSYPTDIILADSTCSPFHWHFQPAPGCTDCATYFVDLWLDE